MSLTGILCAPAQPQQQKNRASAPFGATAAPADTPAVEERDTVLPLSLVLRQPRDADEGDIEHRPERASDIGQLLPEPPTPPEDWFDTTARFADGRLVWGAVHLSLA